MGIKKDIHRFKHAILSKFKDPAIQLKRFLAFWIIPTSLTHRLFGNIFHFLGSRRRAYRKVLWETG